MEGESHGKQELLRGAATFGILTEREPRVIPNFIFPVPPISAKGPHCRTNQKLEGTGVPGCKAADQPPGAEPEDIFPLG